MKWVLNVLAILLVLAGIIWILQGTGVFPVGFMAHEIKWTYAGIVLIVGAIGLFILANRRRK